MTVKQWWKEIASYTEAGDWNGILVAADGLEGLGEGEVAATLRWAIRKGFQIKHLSLWSVNLVPADSPLNNKMVYGFNAAEMWQNLHHLRMAMMELLEVDQ